MADTTTPLLQLVDQDNGNNNNTWGDIADANFLKLENAIAGVTTIASNSASITLTDDQARPMIQVLTGTLTANQTIVVPTRTKLFLFKNSTTGSFFTIVKTAAGNGVLVPQGGVPLWLFCDGTHVSAIAPQGADIGTIKMHGSVTAPAGYLNCDGTAISRSSYAALFAVIGTNFGVGDGSTTFNLPDLRGRAPVGQGTGAGLTTWSIGGAAGGESITLSSAHLPAHIHTITDPSHSHPISDPTHAHGSNNLAVDVTVGNVGGTTAAARASGSTLAASTGVTVQGNYTGITQTNVNSTTNNAFNIWQPSLGVNFIIRYL